VAHREEKVPGNRISLYEFLLLAGLVSALTLAAALVYPIWDDARLMFLIGESGNRAIRVNFDDRPLVSLLFVFLSNHQLFLPIGLVFHWITWLAMGLVTMRLWRLMFPAYSRFALLPALLSVAPILCKVQLVIVTVVFIVLLGPLLSFVGIFMLLTDQPSLWRKIIFDAAAFLLIAFSILISEYAVLTALAGFVLLTAKAIGDRKDRRREPLVIAALFALCALGSYLTFSVLTKSTASTPYRPSFAFQSFFWKVKVIPFRLLSGLWRGAIGGVLESLGSVTLNSKVALLSFVCGAVVAGIATLAIYRTRDVASTRNQARTSVITLLTATAVALIPVLVMERTLDSRWDSRFLVPLVPLLSSLTVFILLSVLSSRLWLLVPVLCGFLTGYWTTFEIASALHNPEPKPVVVLETGRQHSEYDLSTSTDSSSDDRSWLLQSDSPEFRDKLAHLRLLIPVGLSRSRMNADPETE
jgi:hypothetical protein